MGASEAVETRREIGMTEAELLEANLAALGIERGDIGKPHDEIVFDAFVSLAKEHGRLPTLRQVASATGIVRQTVGDACQRLIEADRMRRVEIRGRPFYLPLTAGAGR